MTTLLQTRKKWHTPLIGLALALAPGCGSSVEPDPKPNVLLISIDTLRADALSCYGSPFATSPHVDALAARGVLFEDPTSTTSWTLPAHLSMLTGLSISAHGICDDRLWAGGGQPMAPLRGEFLSETLSRAGYTTAGFYAWKYLEPEFGFGPGFETWQRLGNTVWSDKAKGARYARMRAEGLDDELRAWVKADPASFDMQAPIANEVVDAGIGWLDQTAANTEKPFFMFMHIFDVHNDYLPPAPFDTAFPQAGGYDGPVDGKRIEAANSPIHAQMPAADLEQVRRLYLGEVAWVDSQLGRLFAALEERGLRDNTIVILTSDHGEEFYEHGHKTHRKQILRENVEVPLIVSWPGHLPEGKRIAGPVGIVDIVPTISSLADVPPPLSVSGRDLSEVMRGEAPNAEVTYVTEMLHFSEGVELPVRHTALRRGKDHWIRQISPEGRAQVTYYNRATNPNESGPGQTFTEGTPQMQAFNDLLDPVREATQIQRDQAPARTLTGSSTASAQQTQDELAGMGYVGGTITTGVQHSSRLCLDGCALPDVPR